jgi:hypothetical protein
MQPREIECDMCGVTDNHDHPDDRKAVPIWNGRLTTSESECDGYKAACAKCYNRWSAWDERMKRSNAKLTGAGQVHRPESE